jgi:hypothetical protein
MDGVNAAVEVGKHELQVALGATGELFATANESRQIKRLAQRLQAVGCVRVLIEGGSYQNLFGGGAAGRRLASGDGQSAPGARVRAESGTAGQDRPARRAGAGAVWRAIGAAGAGVA